MDTWLVACWSLQGCRGSLDQDPMNRFSQINSYLRSLCAGTGLGERPLAGAMLVLGWDWVTEIIVAPFGGHHLHGDCDV